MKHGTLFRRLILLVIMAILIVAAIVGVAFMRIAGPVFTRVRADEILTRAQSVVSYYQQYLEGEIQLRAMQDAIKVSGTFSNAQLQIFDARGELQIWTMDRSPDFFYQANSPQMQAITLPVAIEAMQTMQSATRTVSEKTRKLEYIVVATPVITNGTVTGAVVLLSSMRVVQSPLQRLYLLLGLSCLIALLIMLLPLYYFLRRMVDPLQQMNTVALSMAQGNFSLRADESTSGEIGELANSINHLATQLGKTMQALLLERNRLQLLVDGLAEGILALDETGGFLHTNPSIYRLFDIEIDEQRLRQAMDACDVMLMQDIQAVAETGQPLSRNVKRDGSVLRVTATPLYDEANICRGVVALFRDITESERLEQTRRDYVANVSHELRTPLSAVRGLAEALSDGMIKTPEDQSRYYGYILRECMRLSRLIEDLLELSRLQSGTIALQKKVVELPQLLEDIRMRYATLSYDLGIGFMVTSDSMCPPVYSNPDRIEQVLVILLDNAFKFTEEGGLVKVYTTHDETNVTVYVEDNGAGIQKEDLPHVFERFYKAEKSHSGGGTGLGLSIAREVMTLMGETISVKSEPGMGTTFSFTLKRASA